MQVFPILQKLPATLEWMVLFNLTPLRGLADDTVVKTMFFLADTVNLDTYSHVVLTSQGRCLAPQDGPELILAEGEPAVYPTISRSDSLASRFSSQLDLFPVNEADCLGLGQTVGFPPVLLFAQVKSGCVNAKALFQQAPSQRHYELLPAIGVKFQGGSYRGEYFVAEFTNRLPTHIHAGILAHFSRTSHCNQFFLQHGNIDFKLATGLAMAAKDRVSWARDHSREAAARLGQQACQGMLAMTCQPPHPAPAYPFGDLVPLGFLLKALISQPTPGEAGQSVLQLLLDRQQGQGWAFHTNRLVTATDSALVLQGLAEVNGHNPNFQKSDFVDAVMALETFANGQGGYYPQLFTEVKDSQLPNSQPEQPGRMTITPSNQHWCQPDYATTCLVRRLRQIAGLAPQTSLAYLAAGFETRSGLYFANPYLVDWVLVMAIQHDEAAGELRTQLLAEILASMNDDYSFGHYDIALSTALAILCLSALGFGGRTMRLAQLRLLNFMGSDGSWPVATPFYSTFFFDHTKLPANVLFGWMLQNDQQQIIQVKGQYHALSFYLDTHRLISTALATLALSEKCLSVNNNPQLSQATRLISHPRYQCSHLSEYITKFALPPYLSEFVKR